MTTFSKHRSLCRHLGKLKGLEPHSNSLIKIATLKLTPEHLHLWSPSKSLKLTHDLSILNHRCTSHTLKLIPERPSTVQRLDRAQFPLAEAIFKSQS